MNHCTFPFSTFENSALLQSGFFPYSRRKALRQSAIDGVNHPRSPSTDWTEMTSASALCKLPQFEVVYMEYPGCQTYQKGYYRMQIIHPFACRCGNSDADEGGNTDGGCSNSEQNRSKNKAQKLPRPADRIGCGRQSARMTPGGRSLNLK